MGLPQLYQRFQSFWDRSVAAVGLAVLLWAAAEATTSYPQEWRLFLVAALVVSGLASPRVAYVLFILLIAYPLYSISVYLAALLLAVMILGYPWATRNLNATVLILVAPALLPWHMEVSIPLLAGLWWGERTGMLVGGLAAVWLKLLAGMAGQTLDLARLSGWAPAASTVVDRFSGLNSFQTVMELINPFAASSQMLMLHLLQVLAWALAGYVVGRLVLRTWSDRWRGWAPLLSAVPAAAVLWATYVFVPYLWQWQEEGFALPSENLMGWVFLPALVAAAARQFYLYLRRPVLRPLRRRTSPQPEPQPPSRPVTPSPHRATSRETIQRSRKLSEADDDLIMLEID
jgi:hypothetical protein